MDIEKINFLWENRANKFSAHESEFIYGIMQKLDQGEERVVKKINRNWEIDENLKKAILLFFRSRDSLIMDKYCFDKIPLKTNGWTEEDFLKSHFRMVPGSVVRLSAYIGRNAVIMPSFINVGAYVDDFSMIDTNATIGSCARIGKNCHISDGVTIGGVLEPLQARPVIIEDDCFVGARSVIAEGIILRRGVVVASGVTLTHSTKIFDKNSGEEMRDEIPEYSVVVPGTYKASSTLDISINCAIIVKRIDKKTRDKTSINALLRDD